MKITDILNKVAEFQNATDQIVNNTPTLTKDYILRYNLMKEENREYAVAIVNEDLVEVLDACVDMMYVLAGTINQHGLQSVFSEAFERVHFNNMTKVGADGKVQRNPEGKILKPAGFIGVDLKDLV